MFFNWLLKKRQQKKNAELGILDKKVKIWVPLALLFPSFIAIFLFTILPFLMVIEKAFTPLADIFNLTQLRLELETLNYYLQVGLLLLG